MTSHPQEPTYTVFVRLPFPRGNFVDPPPANWDSSKDEALWNIVSRLSKTTVDCNANDFGVTVDFLLQQVAWLTERHASQVRAQMRKAAAAAKGSSAPSPQPGPEGPFAAEPMRRAGSGDKPPRAPSSLSIRKDSPRNDGSVPGTPMRSTPRPTATRTSSANTTVYTTRNLGGSGKAPVKPRADDPQRRRLSSLPIATSVDDDKANNANQESAPLSPSASEPSDAEPPSSSSSSSSSSPAQSRIIRRPPRFQGSNSNKATNDPASAAFSADDEEDEDVEPVFLYKPQQQQHPDSGSSGHDLSATLRGNLPRGDHAAKRHVSSSFRGHRSQTSDSSTSSAARPSAGGGGGGPLSPRRTMELAGRSPGGKGKAYSRDSDGTPSMGSSFSDLDDASVTQSALEEALASRLQDTTISSLRGTIGALGTLGSRYLPRKGNP
ncbi:hypothetical protein M426DRAFT_76566 [Hypoxylon sp. CI-4A]|nr:hypothetical protein M426DRAFT_76566 [Hypoxylon sp. CI-4A]